MPDHAGGPPRHTHEISEWIEIYSRWDHLLKPEEVVLEALRADLPKMKMLDIGIGGGRTTHAFADLPAQYVGIDFDDGMIEACKKRFPDRSPRVTFLRCDARSMRPFGAGEFDFLLFSFNGIDYLGPEDRPSAFKEVLRVGKAGGYFLFSSHNLNSIERLFARPQSSDFRTFTRQLVRHVILRLRNQSVKALKTRDHAIIYDGVYSTNLRWLIPSLWKRLGFFYYSRPELQLRQLKEYGFQDITVYDIEGREIRSNAALRTNTDFWLHYLCRM